MKTCFILLAVLFLSIIDLEQGPPVHAWLAEAWTSAKVLTRLDQDFQNNMSGVFWNPKTRTFWVCCNGGPSAFWALREDGAGSLMIATNDTQTPAKYVLAGGDLEGICQVDYDSPRVCLLFEGEDLIKEYNGSTYGKAVLETQWDISAYVPTKGGKGSEGITFIPNEWLIKSGFVDARGLPYISQNDLHGLMFVGHQNGGKIYVFDLSRENKSVHFVGAYKTSRKDSSALEFDRSDGLLYVWHNIGPNYLEITRLSSLVDGEERYLSSVAEFVGPKGGNLEGIAIASSAKNDKWCLIVDDDNQAGAAIMWFRQFRPSMYLLRASVEAGDSFDKKRCHYLSDGSNISRSFPSSS